MNIIFDGANIIFNGVNIIFDGGSQKTYMSQRLVNKLNLKAIGKQETEMNAFGEAKGKLITVKEFNLMVTSNI